MPSQTQPFFTTKARSRIYHNFTFYLRKSDPVNWTLFSPRMSHSRPGLSRNRAATNHMPPINNMREDSTEGISQRLPCECYFLPSQKASGQATHYWVAAPDYNHAVPQNSCQSIVEEFGADIPSSFSLTHSRMNDRSKIPHRTNSTKLIYEIVLVAFPFWSRPISRAVGPLLVSSSLHYRLRPRHDGVLERPQNFGSLRLYNVRTG